MRVTLSRSRSLRGQYCSGLQKSERLLRKIDCGNTARGYAQDALKTGPARRALGRSFYPNSTAGDNGMKVRTALVAALFIVGGGLSSTSRPVVLGARTATTADSGGAAPAGDVGCSHDELEHRSHGRRRGRDHIVGRLDGQLFGRRRCHWHVRRHAQRNAISPRNQLRGRRGQHHRPSALDLTGGTVDVAATASGKISSVVSGFVGLTKTGAGTLTLDGADLYNGLTNVSAGILTATNATSLGSAADATSVASVRLSEVTATMPTDQHQQHGHDGHERRIIQSGTARPKHSRAELASTPTRGSTISALRAR